MDLENGKNITNLLYILKASIRQKIVFLSTNILKTERPWIMT